MKTRQLLKRFPGLFLALLISCLFTFGCDEGNFSECSYTSGLSDPGYANAIIIYPCESIEGPFAATTLTGGFADTKEQMNWIAEHMVSSGYIVILMTPNNIFGGPPVWQKAHLAGIEKLKSENLRPESPIYGLVDTDKLQLSGYSMGGAGALLAAQDLGDEISTVQAFAPFGAGNSLSEISAAAICYAGSEDTTAPPEMVKNSYNGLSDSVTRTFAQFTGVEHKTWINGDETIRTRFLTYIISWMKVHLDGNENYEEYINGNQDWFDDFARNEDA